MATFNAEGIIVPRGSGSIIDCVKIDRELINYQQLVEHLTSAIACALIAKATPLNVMPAGRHAAPARMHLCMKLLRFFSRIKFSRYCE